MTTLIEEEVEEVAVAMTDEDEDEAPPASTDKAKSLPEAVPNAASADDDAVEEGAGPQQKERCCDVDRRAATG